MKRAKVSQALFAKVAANKSQVRRLSRSTAGTFKKTKEISPESNLSELRGVGHFYSGC